MQTDDSLKESNMEDQLRVAAGGLESLTLALTTYGEQNNEVRGWLLYSPTFYKQHTVMGQN